MAVFRRYEQERRNVIRRIGILGAGNISEQYVLGLASFHDLEILRVGDIEPERAFALAQRFGIPHAGHADEIYTDPDIDIVVSLAPPMLHGTTAAAALENNKSVYVEKPLATNREEGLALLELERRSIGTIGSAPDTFLGSAAQTARAAIDDGMIGTPIGATAFVRSSRAETWHPDPTFLFTPGGGPVMDMGPYYITALVHLLGPVARVTGAGRIGVPRLAVTSPERRVEFIDVAINTHTGSVLVFENGVIATTQFSFDAWDTELPYLEVYGSEGTLLAHNPGQFDGDVRLRRHGDTEWRVLDPVRTPWGRPGTPEQRRRGLGVADLSAALDGEPQRTSSSLAFHVLDTLVAIEDSAANQSVVEVASTVARPAPLPRNTHTETSL
jgi:predicted dehydrogenase